MTGAARLGVLVGGSKHGRADGSVTFSLDLLDLDGEGLRVIELDFLPHGFATMPARPAVAALFEKRGPHACLVELTTGRARPIAAGERRAFYGHGVFSPDSRYIYGVEIDTDTHEGLLVIREASTARPLAEMKTYGKNPHECLLLSDGATLAITNGGGPLGDTSADAAPCVTFVDLESRKLIERVPLSDPRINAGHVAVGDDGAIAVVSAPREGLRETEDDGGFSLGRRGAGLPLDKRPAPRAGAYVGESLSVAIHEPTGTALATHPWGGALSLWRVGDGELLASFDLESPRGVAVTLDGRYFVVSHGKDGAVSLLDPSARAFVAGSTRNIGRFTGSHVYTWNPVPELAFGVA